MLWQSGAETPLLEWRRFLEYERLPLSWVNHWPCSVLGRTALLVYTDLPLQVESVRSAVTGAVCIAHRGQCWCAAESKQLLGKSLSAVAPPSVASGAETFSEQLQSLFTQAQAAAKALRPAS